MSIVNELGHRSESWLHRQLLAPVRHRIVVCACRHFNRSEYPFPQVVGVPALWPRLLDRIRRDLKLSPKTWVEVRARMFKRVLASRHIRLVQAHFGSVAFEVWPLVESDSRPFVVWLYGSDVFRTGCGREDRLPLLFKTRATFVCTSNALRDEVIRPGCDPSKVRVIYPGISIPDSYSDHPALGPLEIISAGRLADVKAPLGLVDIVQHLKRMGVRFRWRHFGDGTLRSEMEHRIRTAGLEGEFQFPGEVRNAILLQEMRLSHVMIHNARVASDGSREAFGVVLVEAAAAGLPVISFRVGGIPEIVQHQKTGFLVNPGEYYEAAKYAAELAANPELRRTLGRQAHEYACRNFNALTQSRMLDEFYDRVLAEHPFSQYGAAHAPNAGAAFR